MRALRVRDAAAPISRLYWPADYLGMPDDTAGTRTLLGDQRKGVIALAIPIGVALFFQQLNSIVDSLWVAGLGGSAMSALGIVYPIYTILIGIGNGLGIGVGAAIARNIGQKNHADANRSAAQGVVISAVVSLILTPMLLLTAEQTMVLMGAGDTVADCLAYANPIYLMMFFIILSGVMSGMLRGEGAARRSMVIQVVGAVVNMVLNPILIYGLDMGVAGSAWATVIAFIVSCAIASYWYLRGRGMYIAIRRSDFRPDMRIWKGIMSVGGPEALELSIMYLFNIFLNFMVIECGGTDMVGLYSTGWRVANFILIIAQSMGGAMVAVCAAEYGMKRFDMIRDAFRFSVRTSIIWTIVLSAVLALGAGTLASVFTVSDDLSYLHDETTRMFYFFALFLPVMSLVYTGSSLMQSINKATGGMVNSLARNVIMSLAFLVATVTFGTLTSLWWAMALSEILGGVMMGVHAYIVLRRTEAREGGTPGAV